jgi:CrcB protein
MNLFLIFLGAGLGGVLRYGVANAVHLVCDREFPWGILVVNISGSFLIGLVFVLMMHRFTHDTNHLSALLVVGFLGGYTTFSAFSLETVMLLESGAVMGALSNIFLTVILCLTATWLGLFLGRQL